MQSIHSAVDPFHDVIAFSTVSGKCGHPIGQSIVICHNAACITVGAQVFTRVKRKRRGVSKSSDVLSFVPGQMGLGAVLYDPKIVPFRNGHDWIHIGRLSVKMDWNNADRGRCDLSLYILGVDRESFLICIAEYDPTAGLRDRLRC